MSEGAAPGAGGEASALGVYARALREHVAPVLSLLDREEHSRTRGCLDRTFWAWKFTDFPGARFQEGLCFLAFLHAAPVAPAYRGNENLARWIAGGFDFWCGIQRPSGDFDEAYPWERSLAATAFTTFYLSEAWGFAAEALPAATRERFVRAVARAGDWLTRNDETHGVLSNHLAAAAGALLHAHRITGEARFETRAWHFLRRILDHQSSEGWYEEYGGADPGYQTHGSFYLERCLELTGDASLAESLDRSYRFLAHFVHPDGSLGGEYTSRNTQTYYPAAFEMAAPRSGSAAWIAERMRPSVASLAAAGLGSVDLYNRFPLLNNTVFAYRALARGATPAKPEPPSEQPGEIHFPSAGLLVVRRPAYDLYVGLHKGGVVKVFDRRRGRLALSDCGYVGRLRGGAVISSQWVDPQRPIEIGPGSVALEGRFSQVSRPVMDPWRFVAFRLVSLVLGRIPRVATWVKALLVRVLIYRRKDVPLALRRCIRFSEAGVDLEDRLRREGALDVEELCQDDVFTTIHMGSSRYFLPQELLASGAPLGPEERRVDPSALADGVLRRRALRLR